MYFFFILIKEYNKIKCDNINPIAKYNEYILFEGLAIHNNTPTIIPIKTSILLCNLPDNTKYIPIIILIIGK